MAPAYYKVKQSFGVFWEGEQITLPAGEFVRAGHPIMKGREEHFEPVESFGRYDVDPPAKKKGQAAPVEQASAAPGEKRP